ncbi:hypothetical protein M5K25_017922 [Dendrobium thyrsiflorum]|uniref:Uncharacterized protein n=1 Tax=Dendrobium thyrsiflorum TaxID=117978 RepID=A0ABD0UNV0_DENTH
MELELEALFGISEIWTVRSKIGWSGSSHTVQSSPIDRAQSSHSQRGRRGVIAAISSSRDQFSGPDERLRLNIFIGRVQGKLACINRPSSKSFKGLGTAHEQI